MLEVYKHRDSSQLKRTLAMSLFVSLVAALLFLSPLASAQGDSCRVCNCQFSNVEVLDQLIEARIRDILANDTTSTQVIQDRIINTLNDGTASTQTLETRITNTVENNLGKPSI